jgi:hypothetical protein
LQTDNTLFLANSSFATAEQQQLEKAQFFAKKRKHFTVSQLIKFNGCTIHFTNKSTITVNQKNQCNNLVTVSEKLISATSFKSITRANFSFYDQYVAQRAKEAYIALMC